MKGWMYILECIDGSYYTGSTNNLEIRLAQHQAGEGANYTKKRLPVKLVYFEEYQRIDDAFYREKQVQGWGRKKKEALIKEMPEELHRLAECKNKSHCKNRAPVVSAPLNDRGCCLNERFHCSIGQDSCLNDRDRCLSGVEGNTSEDGYLI